MSSTEIHCNFMWSTEVLLSTCPSHSHLPSCWVKSLALCLNTPHLRESPKWFYCTLLIQFSIITPKRLPAHEGRNYFPRAWLTFGSCHHHTVLLPSKLSLVFAGLTSGSFLHSSGIHPFLILLQEPNTLCLCTWCNASWLGKAGTKVWTWPTCPWGTLALRTLFASRTHILGRVPFPLLPGLPSVPAHHTQQLP